MGHFDQISYFMARNAENHMFCPFWGIFAKQINKTHKITSDFYDIRKILTKKFWSQGTNLGSLGPVSREAFNEIFFRFQILVIWGPYDLQIPTAPQEKAKNLKTAPSCSGTWVVQSNWIRSLLVIRLHFLRICLISFFFHFCVGDMQILYIFQRAAFTAIFIAL